MIDVALGKFKLALIAMTAFAIFALATMGYNHVYHKGFEAADAKARQREEVQKKINEKAIATAEEALRKDLENIRIEKEMLEDEISRLNEEAAQDPDANLGALGADSVRRLNAIR